MNASRIEMSLPDYVASTIEALESDGFEAWCVGGCVRDAILRRAVNDYDIATNARWQEAEHTLTKAGLAVHRTGIKHGTVTAVLEGFAMEVTTYRVDGDYSDGRHPDNVRFVSDIREDLSRRDFTMNALAYHPQRGLLDCGSGIHDIEHRIIRVVGDASERFKEDSLRILRGCRFASQLGFNIERTTLEAMNSHKMRMMGVSSERITHELQSMLLGDHIHDALLKCIDIIGAILPELVAMRGFEQHTPYHIYDVLEHTAWVVQRCPATPLARWTALLHDVGKPGAFFMDGERGHFYGHPRLSAAIAQGTLQRFTLSPALREDILTLVRLHDKTIPATTKAVRKTLASLEGNVELFRTLCKVKQADALAQSELSLPRYELAVDLESILDELVANEEALTVKQLAISGKDVLDLGVPAGPRVGELLDNTFNAVVEERIQNERDQLIAFIEQSLMEEAI